MPAVTFDRANRELRTVRFHYAGKNMTVSRISWEQGTRRGVAIAADQLLATIRWSTGASEEIRAPASCVGTISRTNRRIDYELLPDESILLLSLDPS